MFGTRGCRNNISHFGSSYCQDLLIKVFQNTKGNASTIDIYDKFDKSRSSFSIVFLLVDKIMLVTD